MRFSRFIGSFAVLSFVVAAKASSLSWSAADFYLDHLTNDGTQGTTWDHLSGTGLSGTLALNLGDIAPIDSHDLSFDVGTSSSGWNYSQGFTLTYSVTLNGVTHSVSQLGTAVSGNTSVAGSPDTLDVLASGPVLFQSGGNAYLYTAKAFHIENAVSGAPVAGKLSASVEAVPEPFNLVLGVSAIGVALKRRRRS